MKTSQNNASIPNPLLQPLAAFVGNWRTTGTHPYAEGKLHGHTSFEWIESGAFLIMRSQLDHELFPDGMAIFGSDNTNNKYYMLYFDERKVSRKMDVSFENNTLKWWRTGPEFSQRYSFTLSDDGNTIVSKGEICKDGVNWEPDLSLDFTRMQ